MPLKNGHYYCTKADDCQKRRIMIMTLGKSKSSWSRRASEQVNGAEPFETLWMNRTSGRVCRYIFSRKQISRPIKFILHSLLESILSSGQSCRCVSSNSEKIVAQNSRLSDDLSFSNSWRIFLTRKIVCSCQFKNPKRIKRTEKITHEVEQFIAAGKKQRYTDLLTHRVSLTNQFYSKSLESISPTSETCWIRVK